jgi:hypothetical protein
VFEQASAHVGVDECGAGDFGSRGDWREADKRLRAIAKKRAALDGEELRWLLVARDERVHVHLGLGTFLEYVERVLGYAPKTAIDRLRTAEALRDLPAMRAALDSGRLPYSAVRELVRRVAKPHNEQAWIEKTAGRTLREIEAMVAGRKPGDMPGDPRDPDLTPRVLRLELSPDVYARWIDARRRIEEEVGHALDDDAFVAALCARGNGDGRDGDGASTKAPYQIAISVCPDCERATQDAAGQVIDVAPEVLERACCDAEQVGRVDGDWPERLTTAIPPATRRMVLRRDHHRCAVPGCRVSRGLEIHHIVAREDGGDHSPTNLITLCTFHHRARHNGHLRITGTAPGHVVFAHADGRCYGQAVRAERYPAAADHPERTEDAFALAKSTLRTAGFSAAEARAAVENARAHVGAGATLEDVIRASLRACPRPSA